MQNRLMVFIVFVVLLISGLSGAIAEPQQTRNSVIVVYYFHRTIRCPSCILLEERTKEAVEFGFEKELNIGSIRSAVINVEENGNEHFVGDYHLNVQSVIISEIHNGKEKRWKNLDQVWALLEDEGRLLEYIQKEIKDYLKD